MGYALPHKVPGGHTPDSVCQVQNDTVSYPQTDTNGPSAGRSLLNMPDS